MGEKLSDRKIKVDADNSAGLMVSTFIFCCFLFWSGCSSGPTSNWQKLVDAIESNE